MGFTAVHLVNSNFLGFSGFVGCANSGSGFHFPRHDLTQLNHRHGICYYLFHKFPIKI